MLNTINFEANLLEIFAANFRDRVVHHLLINAIEPFYEDISKSTLAYKEEVLYFIKRELKVKGYLALQLRDRAILKEVSKGLDFLGYVIHHDYVPVRRQRVVKNFKQKKAQYLECYEALRGTMDLAEIKAFLTVQASFLVHVKHANSYNLIQKVGVIHESNPFHCER